MAKKSSTSSRAQSKAIEGIQGPKMGKPKYHSEHTSHSVHMDEKGKRHHRVTHEVRTEYEYPMKDDGAVEHVLAGRGY